MRIIEILKNKYKINAKYIDKTNNLKITDSSYLCPIHNRIHTSLNLSYIPSKNILHCYGNSSDNNNSNNLIIDELND
jgi:DNA primase